jgi:hypothetical protein
MDLVCLLRQPHLLLYVLRDSRWCVACVCATHILVINTQARLLTEKHFSYEFIFAEVYINKLEPLPLSSIPIYIGFFNITRRFRNPCRKKTRHAPETGWLHMTYKAF